MKKNLSALLILFTISSTIGFGSIFAAGKEAPSMVSLNGTWQFQLAKNEQEATLLTNFYQLTFESPKFVKIPVPSNWAVLGFEEPVYKTFKDDAGAIGYYLYDFKTPEDWDNKRILLHFGGVWSMADVWLNGKYLGNHGSGFTSFSMEATDCLNKGKLNRLAVKVQQTSSEYKFDVHDDWSLGGIYRDVTLQAMPRERWLDQVTVQTTFDSYFMNADMKIRVMVADDHKSKSPGNYPLGGSAYELQLTLSDQLGNPVKQELLKIPGHTNTYREVPVCMHITEPHQWTAETPYLYLLRVDLVENGKTVQSQTERIGFRQISTQGSVFRINGQAVKLRGVNRHDEHPDVGRATTREHWLKDLTMMKAANINYIRLSHYCPAKGFLELCDEMGMYVGDEIAMGASDSYLNNPLYTTPALQRAFETVKRDLNHPSVVYWSVGNEDPFTTIHLDAARLVKSQDSTRPVLLPWRTEEWLPEEIDIIAPHYWKPEEYDRLAGSSTRPIISTEYTHAFGNDGMGDLEACWKALTKYPAGAGAAVWMWADQGLKTPVTKAKSDLAKDDKYLRLVDEGWDGIVDSYRNPTRDYWEVKAVYAQVYPAVDKLVFTPGQKSIEIPIQNDFDFSNLSAVNIKWAVWEDEKELFSGNSQLSGQAHSISTLKLVVDQLKTIQSDKTYYIRFSFSKTDDTEICCKAVELCPSIPAQSQRVTFNKPAVKATDVLTVEVGEVSYTFNPQTGELQSARKNSKLLLNALKPVIWHTTDKCESYISGGRQVRDASMLATFKPNVLSWKVSEQNNQVIINAQVNYIADDKNTMLVDYLYTINNAGQLTIHYEFNPKVSIPWLPVIGMSMETPSTMDKLRWLGLGPYDAYPNKKAAPTLGVWGGKAGSTDVVGNKQIRWAERSGTEGTIRITGNAYMEHRAASPQHINILSGVLGRPEKSRKAGASTPQLRTNTNEPFVGEFSIDLK